MKTKNIKVSIEIEKPRRCGECPFFSYQEYRCHNEWGYESCCSLGFMNDDMRDRDYSNKLYEKCGLK